LKIFLKLPQSSLDISHGWTYDYGVCFGRPAL
jgi:hypothetical protein